MVTHKVTGDGYEFYFKDSLIAVGSYTKLGFEVCENDDGVSVHPNGMVAMTYIKKKYTPEFYATIPKFDFTKPVAGSNRLNTFKKHPALEGVHPLPCENWPFKQYIKG